MNDDGVIEGEVIALLRNGNVVVVDGEETYSFRSPLRKVRVGHRVVAMGRHRPSQKRAQHRAFDADFVDCDLTRNFKAERDAWLLKQQPHTDRTRSPEWKNIVVIGTQKACDDVARHFKDHKLALPLFVTTIPARAEVITAALKEEAAKNPDVILLVRGGGNGVHEFNDLELLKTIVEVRRRIPIVAGIGHAEDPPTLADLLTITQGTPSLAAGFVTGTHADPVVEEVREYIRSRDSALVLWKVIAMVAFFVGAALGAVIGSGWL